MLHLSAQVLGSIAAIGIVVVFGAIVSTIAYRLARQ
jgi:hypothetical protein